MLHTTVCMYSFTGVIHLDIRYVDIPRLISAILISTPAWTKDCRLQHDLGSELGDTRACGPTRRPPHGRVWYSV